MQKVEVDRQFPRSVGGILKAAAWYVEASGASERVQIASLARPRGLSGTEGGLSGRVELLAFMATITFAVKRSHEAFLALVIMELVITFLFYLLYLLKLDAQLKFMFWPLADAFNSLVAALFLLIVGLCATIIKTIKETVIGGVFCLMLFILCIIDATLILKKVTFNRS